MRSLRARLLGAVIALALAGLLVSGIATYFALRSFLVQRLDTQLIAIRPLAAAAVTPDGSGFRSPDAGRFRFPRPPGEGGAGGGGFPAALPGGSELLLVDPDGTVVAERGLDFYSTAPPAVRLPHPLPAVPQGGTTLLEAGTADGDSYRVALTALPSGRVLAVATPLHDVESTLAQLVQLELLIGVVVLAAIALIASVILQRGLRPLEEMGATAGHIAAGDYSLRVAPAEPRSEVGRLGLALNAMLAEIERAFAERTRSEQRLRRVIADASHELRTPLTSIRGYAELMRRRPGLTKDEELKARRRIEEEAIRMTAVVEDLLLLARLDQGRPLEQEPVDLALLTREACQDLGVTSPGRELKVAAARPVVVTGDELRLRQVIGNLVRNADVHTPAGTPVEVSVRRDGTHGVLTVRDHGHGLTGETRDRVFEPFFRADESRSRDSGGAGLGLAIVSAVVQAHGGKVALTDTPGGGATFSVELPLAG